MDGNLATVNNLHNIKTKYQDEFACMENIPYCTGYSATQWKKMIDVFIMTDSTIFMVNRLQPIPLKEADQNENSKYMAKDKM